MTRNSSDSTWRIVPRCMRITEPPIRLPAGATQLLALLPLDTGESADAVGVSELESFALHTWRLGRRVDGMDAAEVGRIKRQLQDSYKRLADALSGLGVTIEDPTSRAYTDGWLEVDVIAWEDPDGPPPDGIDGPWVKQTIRPLIRRAGDLLSKGEVVIADPERGRQSNPATEETKT